MIFVSASKRLVSVVEVRLAMFEVLSGCKISCEIQKMHAMLWIIMIIVAHQTEKTSLVYCKLEVLPLSERWPVLI